MQHLKDPIPKPLFYFSVWTCFTPSITLYNGTGGCGGLPLLSRRYATQGSTEASSPLLSIGFKGAKPPLLLNTPPSTKDNTSKPFILVFDECVTLRQIGQNTLIKTTDTPPKPWKHLQILLSKKGITFFLEMCRV